MKSLNDVIWEDIDLQEGKEVKPMDVSINSSCGERWDPTKPYFLIRKSCYK